MRIIIELYVRIICYFVCCSGAFAFQYNNSTLFINLLNNGFVQSKNIKIVSNEVNIVLYNEDWNAQKFYISLHKLICLDYESKNTFYVTDVSAEIDPYDDRFIRLDKTRNVPWISVIRIRKKLQNKPRSLEWFCQAYVRNQSDFGTEMHTYDFNLNIESSTNMKAVGRPQNLWEARNTILHLFESKELWWVFASIALVVVFVQSLVIVIMCRRCRTKEESTSTAKPIDNQNRDENKIKGETNEVFQLYENCVHAPTEEVYDTVYDHVTPTQHFLEDDLI